MDCRGRNVPRPRVVEGGVSGVTDRRPAPTRSTNAAELVRLNARIVACRLCARLVAHREAVALPPPRRHSGQEYWARPLPGFGDPDARVLLVGLAPAAHGGNRTGRMFTGDQSGTWLFRALHEAGFANQPTSEHRADGLRLRDAYITAAARCAPPANKPTPGELAACRPYLLDELRYLGRVRVVIGLGRIGWTTYLQARRALGAAPALGTPAFGHNVATRFADGCVLLGCYHPSQQNTFTGKLTRPMLRRVFVTARRLLERPPPATVSRRDPRGAGAARRR